MSARVSLLSFFSTNKSVLSSDKAVKFTTRSVHQYYRAQHSHSIDHVSQRANLSPCMHSIPSIPAGTTTPKQPV